MPFSGSPKRGCYHTAASTFLDYKPKVPRTVSAEMPMSATVFLEFVVPQRIETAFFCNPRASASMSQTALFAFPLSGGDCTRTFNRSPTNPEISFREAHGITLMQSETPVLVASINDIKHLRMFFCFVNNDGNVARTDVLHRELLGRVSNPRYYVRVLME